MELKLKIPSVTVNWQNKSKIIGVRKPLVPPKYFGVVFPDFFVESNFPDIQLPDRFFPSESKLDTELAYTGYSWYLGLFGDMKDLFETGRAHLHKKSPIEAFYYFKRSKDKAQENGNALFYSASLFWGIEALLEMDDHMKANVWRKELLTMKNDVSIPYVSSARFYSALQACKNNNFYLCAKHLEAKKWKDTNYSDHATFLKAWVLLKQKKFTLAQKKWVYLSRHKGPFQIRSLVNAGIVSAKKKRYAVSLNYFERAIKLSGTKQKIDSSYESVAIYGKAWSELRLGRYQGALVSFQLFEKKYPTQFLISSVHVGRISAKLRLFRKGNFRANVIIKEVESFRKLFPDSSQVQNLYLELAWALFEKQQFLSALQFATKLSNRNPLRRIYPISLILEGLCLYHKGEFSKSFGILKRANELSEYRSFQGEERLKEISSLIFSFVAIRLKDYKVAKDTLNSLLSLEKSADKTVKEIASVWLGEILLLNGKYARAKDIYSSIPSSSPSYLQSRMGLAWIHFLREDWEKSANLFEKTFYSDPFGKFASEALFRSAESKFNLGDYQKAIDTFDRVEKRFDGTLVSERALFQKIKLLIQRNKLKIAEPALSRFLKKYSKSKFLDEVKFNYALIPFHKLNYKVSLKRLRNFVKSSPNSKFLPKAFLRIGDAQYNLQDFEDAEKSYSLIVKKFASHLEAREAAYSFAMTNARRKNFSKFLIEARQVIKKSPKDILSIALSFQIAEMFYSRRKLKNAFEEYLQIVAEHPNSPFAAQALFRISMIHSLRGKIDASLSSYERVLKKYPKHRMRANVLFGLGETLFKIGRYLESKKWLVLFLSEFSSHEYEFLVRYRLGICYRELGEKELSIKQFEKVIETPKKSSVELRVNSMIELGSILIQEGRFSEAKKTLLPASKLKDPSISARAQFLLILILEKKKIQNTEVKYLKLAYKFYDDRDIVCRSLLKSSSLYESRGKLLTAQKILEKIGRSVNLKKCNKIAVKELHRLSSKIRVQ
ncbi:MAG: tetratricopeptide repeat protein [Nitrospinota bacterium]|nr:tetratricopeptide repeat protein [Nitrospinota bacterium]